MKDSDMQLEVERFVEKNVDRSEDPAARLRKLGEEFGELAEAVAGWRAAGSKMDDSAFERMRREAGDLAVVLFDFANLAGFGIEDAMLDVMADYLRREEKRATQSSADEWQTSDPLRRATT